jgi:hypothetical protein
MTNEPELVTVYRSADMNAESDARAACELLAANGIRADIFGDTAPGVVDGTWEVRVAASDAARAESLLSTIDQDDPGKADPSRDLDTVPIAELQGTTGEMEALGIQSILDANGIPAVLVGASTLPNLSFQVRVARADLDRARAALEEARAAGPVAAVEAERETEQQPFPNHS